MIQIMNIFPETKLNDVLVYTYTYKKSFTLIMIVKTIFPSTMMESQ